MLTKKRCPEASKIPPGELEAILGGLPPASTTGAYGELLVGLPDGPAPESAEAAAIYLIAAVEGLTLQRLERGETPELARARAMFIDSAPAAISR